MMFSEPYEKVAVSKLVKNEITGGDPLKLWQGRFNWLVSFFTSIAKLFTTGQPNLTSMFWPITILTR